MLTNARMGWHFGAKCERIVGRSNPSRPAPHWIVTASGPVWNVGPSPAYNFIPLLPTASMLIALLATVLSASPVPADSVRAPAKPGAVRPDTTLLTMPAPTISVPTQSAPEVVLPIRPVTAVAAPLVNPLDQAIRSTGVLQQAAAPAAHPPHKYNLDRPRRHPTRGGP